jgi:protein tyrosine/serine phosphatase
MRARNTVLWLPELELLKRFIAPALTLSLILSIALPARASRRDDPAAAGTAVAVKISNFGKVNEHYYRGAQPKGDAYQQLAALGVKTIIDLRDDPKDYARPLAERAGLRYINFPLSATDYPASDADERFLELVNNPAHWPVYVHCAGGRHRTGIMTAVYRMRQEGWDPGRAYREMKQYDFYTRWGHRKMKDYIFDYARKLEQRRAQPAAAEKAAGQASN